MFNYLNNVFSVFVVNVKKIMCYKNDVAPRSFYKSARTVYVAASFLVLSLCCPAVLRAQNLPLNRLFLSGAVQYFVVSDLSSLVPDVPGGSLIDPLPGFRLGLGYQGNHLRLSGEGGWTKVKGDNPLVREADLVPFMFQAGWDFTLSQKAGLHFGPVLGLGIALTKAEHYRNALDMITGKLSHSEGMALLVHPGLELNWTFLKKFSLYAEAGAALVPEQDGLIPLPEIRAGIRLRPFAARETRVAAAAEAEPSREVYTIYFGPDSVFPLKSSLAVLDEVGKLAAQRDVQITLNGYAAPFAGAAGQQSVSKLRMQNCAEYLQTSWGIAERRITKQWFGADGLPERADGTHESRRVVEIIITK